MRSTYSALALCGCMCAGACAESHGDGRPPPMSATTIDASTADVTALCLSDLGHALAWDEPGSWGMTPAEAFLKLEGSCSAPYSWFPGEHGDVRADPASAFGQLTISVTLDRESARSFSEHRECRVRIEAQALVHVETADGLLNESGSVVVHYLEAAGHVALTRLEIPAHAIEGTLRLTSSKQSPSLLVQNSQIVGGCQGVLVVALEDPGAPVGAIRSTVVAGVWKSGASTDF